jgi:hypothetical protein
VVIGFEQPIYEVGEGDGSVNVRIAVMMGMLRRDVVVAVATQDDTAVGKSVKFIVIYWKYCSFLWPSP